MAHRILGIDPGLNFTGWGVVEKSSPNSLKHIALKHIAHGVITTKPTASMATRLATLYCGIEEIVSSHKPTIAAIEETFVNSNAQSTMKLREARGAILAALGNAELAVASFAPNSVKKAVSGQGHAPKEQVAKMVGMLLNVPNAKINGMSNDATDALAIAICGLYNNPIDDKIGEQTNQQ